MGLQRTRQPFVLESDVFYLDNVLGARLLRLGILSRLGLGLTLKATEFPLKLTMSI